MQKTFLKRLAACALACLLLPGSLAALAEETSIETDSSAETYPAYLDKACVLLAQPLPNAPTLIILPQGSPVLVMAHEGEYVRVNVQVAETKNGVEPMRPGAEGSVQNFQVSGEAPQEDREASPQDFSEPAFMEGYVPLENLASPKPIKAASRVCYAVEAAVLYTDALEYAYTNRCLSVGDLVQVDGVSGQFSHIRGVDAYVYTSALKKLNAKATKAAVGFGLEAIPLYGVVDGEPIPLDATVPANTLLDLEWTYRDWYCVFYDGIWGLVAKEDIQKLKAEKLPAQVAAVLPKGTPLLAEPLAGGPPSGKTVPKDTPLWVKETTNGHVAIALDDEMVFAPYTSLRVIDELKKVSQYEGYVEWGAPLLDFPSAEVGVQIGEAPANSLVKISASNPEYALVKSGSVKGYIAIKDFVSLKELFSDPDRLNNYHILVNKATRELTVFLADSQGNPTETILQQAKVTIGRKTMPTPVGTFKLGQRQRWRSFAPRFAPFAIQFTSWQRKLFIHGPMCFHPNENSISKEALLEFGQQKTSGCVRVPYDVMLWIYCHCGRNNTVLEIIGGKS